MLQDMPREGNPMAMMQARSRMTRKDPIKILYEDTQIASELHRDSSWSGKKYEWRIPARRVVLQVAVTVMPNCGGRNARTRRPGSARRIPITILYEDKHIASELHLDSYDALSLENME